jgi:hypothetical protein
MNLISQIQKVFGKVASVLSADARDQCFFL